MTISRRRLIHLVGRAGGVAAAYRTMAAMGLLAVPAAYAGPPPLPPGKNRTVVIVGAGIAGMVLAWELQKAGYAPQVLEARPRSGGRNWSLRAGDEVLENGSVQRVRWPTGEHLYFNPGPARLPYHHDGILGYCRELQVPLEVMCNDNRGALLQDDAAFGGQPQRNRRAVNDTRGYIAELAAKAVDQAALAGPVDGEDRERLRAFVRSFGALDRDMAYRGSARAGYAVPPGAGNDKGTLAQPLDLRALLASDFWRFELPFGESWDQAATMMQPVGGMGRIGQTFARKLGPAITNGAVVTALRRTGQGARVEWTGSDGVARKTETPFVIVTIPFPVLRAIPADFAPDIRAAIEGLQYVPAGKAAFYATRRFWELDEAIYGGISWTSADITQVWYPSAGIGLPRGVLLGAYVWSDKEGRAFAAKPPAQRLSDALADLGKLHPDGARWLGRGVAVAWPNVPFTGGAWSDWDADGRAAAYPRLLRGDGPFLFAGEHMSWLPGWQEGAVRSAHLVLADVAERMRG